MRRLSSPDLRLDERHADELDLDQDVVRSERWIRDLAQRQDLRCSELLDYDRSHLYRSDPDTHTIVPPIAAAHNGQLVVGPCLPAPIAPPDQLAVQDARARIERQTACVRECRLPAWAQSVIAEHVAEWERLEIRSELERAGLL